MPKQIIGISQNNIELLGRMCKDVFNTVKYFIHSEGDKNVFFIYGKPKFC